MHHSRMSLVLALIILAGCALPPSDPNKSRADQKVRERYFNTCEPSTEVPPKLVGGQTPIYPVQRLLAREDGYAIIEFDVTPEGATANVTKVESSHPAFASHSRIAVLDWTFEPAIQDGVPVAAHCSLHQTYSAGYKDHPKH